MKHLRALLIGFLLTAATVLGSCSLFPSIKYEIELSRKEVTFNLSDAGMTIFANPKRNGGDFITTVNWYSDNVEVCTVNDGYIVPKSVGATNVWASIPFDNTKACCRVIVLKDEVTIKLNNDFLNIEQGRTRKLIPKISHTVDTAVTFSGGGNGISVDDSGLISVSNDAPIGSKATITATSKYDPNKVASCDVTVIERKEYDYDYTFMYYFSGSTLENSTTLPKASPGCISQDIREILSASKDFPESVTAIIETGGATKWALESKYIDGAYEINPNKLQRWQAVDGKLKLIETLATNYMAKEESLEDFLTWGSTNYSALQTGFVISGHGSGIGGCAIDDNYSKKTLSTSDIANAVSSTLNKVNRDKYTFIGYDCCCMEVSDIASINADYFDYMISSQEVEYGEGWLHDSYLKLAAKDPFIEPSELLEKAVDTFILQGEKDCSKNDPCLQTLSVLDLRKMNKLTQAFNNYVDLIKPGAITYSKCKQAFLNSYNLFGEKLLGLVDFEDFLNKLQAQFVSVSTDNVLSALHDVVVYNKYCRYYNTKPCGLCAFFSESADRDYYMDIFTTDYNKVNSTKFKKWQQMLLSYGEWYK